MLSNFARAVAAVFTHSTHRSELKNSAPMQEAKAAANEQAERDRIAKNIRDGKAEEQGKDLSL